MVRADNGLINTHFRNFRKPMGLALNGHRLAVGTAWEIWTYHNFPALAPRLEPAGKHDVAFLPRSATVTGDIQVHEMAWAGDDIWFVNTRFSCLCTAGTSHSFVPRWRPRFITALAPQDRCHLNGLCMEDVGERRGVSPTCEQSNHLPASTNENTSGLRLDARQELANPRRPRFVTALGSSDTQGGWREHKRDGGVLIDVPTGEFVLRGLSMPHSPRWHNGKLWLLESGNGTLGTVDLKAGKYQPIAQLPGFTRGLDFYGPWAFIGLSQVRESAVFSGIAIAERPLEERCCGVWVVNVQTGQTVAFLKFQDAVQEIFAVQVLPGVRYPDLVNDNPALLADSFVLPDAALADVPEPLRVQAPGEPGALAPGSSNQRLAVQTGG